MYMGPEMMQYFQQLHKYLHAQSKNMETLKKLIEKLNNDMAELKEKQAPPPVIKNEYKFDLLKVERLEGTLNIGLNPNGTDGSVGEYSINQASGQRPAQDSDSPAFARVQKEIYDYLNHDAYSMLERIEQEFGHALDDNYRTFIVDDIKKQIDSRIRYYLNQAQAEGWEPEQIDALCDRTIQKVKRDIERTCETFVRNLPRGGIENGHDL
ncbi:spore germination protein GerPC [Brevibacillus sp. GCM10020057]|uniref:spore germination protein GerPC n=1 Tax=Brevibacillus sp. GCM10020057 TaxID=3317327 RepID=UPI003642EE2D